MTDDLCAPGAPITTRYDAGGRAGLILVTHLCRPGSRG